MIVSASFFTVLLILPVLTTKMEPYIVGGEDVNIRQYPHSLFLYIKCVEPQSCGGSILTQHILLSAAHCFEDCIEGDEIVAYAGHESLDKMTSGRRVSAFDVHEDYSRKYVYPDIALAYMAKPWELHVLKRVIITSTYYPVTQATVAGWGTTNEQTGERRRTLQAVKQQIQPPNICKTASNKVFPGMMCGMNFETYPSHGDSGSALVLSNGQQIGMVSWRSKSMNALVIYTNITYFYDWIMLRSSQLQCNQNNK